MLKAGAHFLLQIFRLLAWRRRTAWRFSAPKFIHIGPYRALVMSPGMLQHDISRFIIIIIIIIFAAVVWRCNVFSFFEPYISWICSPVTLLLTVAGVRLVSVCSKAARGVRTSTSVQKTRRCATTAHVATWTTATCATVTEGTLGRRVVNGETLCRLLSAPRLSLPSASVHLSFSVSRRLLTYLLLCLQCFDAVGWAARRASGP